MAGRSRREDSVIAFRRDESDWPAIKMIAAVALHETGRFTHGDIAAALSLPAEAVGRIIEAGSAA